MAWKISCRRWGKTTPRGDPPYWVCIWGRAVENYGPQQAMDFKALVDMSCVSWLVLTLRLSLPGEECSETSLLSVILSTRSSIRNLQNQTVYWSLCNFSKRVSPFSPTSTPKIRWRNSCRILLRLWLSWLFSAPTQANRLQGNKWSLAWFGRPVGPHKVN